MGKRGMKALNFGIYSAMPTLLNLFQKGPIIASGRASVLIIECIDKRPLQPISHHCTQVGLNAPSYYSCVESPFAFTSSNEPTCTTIWQPSTHILAETCQATARYVRWSRLSVSEDVVDTCKSSRF